MQGRGSMLPKRFQMVRSRIAFVAAESILRINRIPFRHASVAMGFCQDRSSGDGNTAGVAVNQGLLLDQHVEFDGIQKQIVGHNSQ